MCILNTGMKQYDESDPVVYYYDWLFAFRSQSAIAETEGDWKLHYMVINTVRTNGGNMRFVRISLHI